jgi:hypothetical protein
MKPFYAARVEDLSALDYLIVECKCGHVGSLTEALANSLLKACRAFCASLSMSSSVVPKGIGRPSLLSGRSSQTNVK